jgi:ABC-type antimicrobial peptide transport system permease subunit
LIDTKLIEETLSTTLTLFEFFVTLVGTIALVLAFFLLLISTTSNITENMWEFGVLRAIGLDKAEVSRVYIYEAFCVTLTSIFFGICVGIIVNAIMTAQFYLFLELPFKLAVRPLCI